ncbi:MAG: hypothetical protein WD052_04600, partial [Bacteroidales bacterium]
HFFNGFYCLGDNPGIVQRRMDGSLRAKNRLKTAIRYSRIISRFPFVRGVFLSGSISKGFMAENDDIDYFIISAPGRLWLSRTLLTVFKKVFLFNSYRNFCLNYFITAHQLEIKERHLYDATEIVFLIPIYNRELYEEFLGKNSWVKNYFPTFRQSEEYTSDGTPWLKQLAEWLLNKTLANSLEKLIHNYSVQYIRKKFKHLEEDVFNKCFRLSENELRYFPDDMFQNMHNKYNKRLLEFQRQSGISLEEDA